MYTTHTNTIHLVRHGENPANITHEFSYKLIDYPLTPKGVLQATQTAEFLKGTPIDAIYSSPLKRAHETAHIIAAPHQLPVTVIEGFREVNVGELELRP
ncbi:MAG: histidine phosphatase family protein, partial [Ktedonobacteraceae bacterium]